MKKITKILLSFFMIMLVASNGFGAAIYQPKGKSSAVEKVDVKEALSAQLLNVKTVFESKYNITDPMQLDYITFGKAHLSDDPSVINDVEWLVLNKTEDTAILVSRKVLGKSEYNEENASVQFTGTKISKWISKFVDEAFISEEKSLIQSSKMLTKSDIDYYFLNLSGSRDLALAYYIRNDLKIDYWLMNENKNTTGMYFSNYGQYSNAQLGEQFGIRPVLVIKYK